MTRVYVKGDFFGLNFGNKRSTYTRVNTVILTHLFIINSILLPCLASLVCCGTKWGGCTQASKPKHSQKGRNLVW